jgi:hypothetical protein
LKISIEQKQSDVNLRRQYLNFIKRDEVAMSSSRAISLDAFPVGFAGQIGLPEWPRSTLLRASGVDRATSLLRIKVNAIAVCILGERNSTARRPSVHQTNFANRLVEEVSDCLNLVLFDPDMTG